MFSPVKNIDGNINVVCYMNIIVQKFKKNNNVKQCYQCQEIGHALQICRLSPKYAKCAGKHISTEFFTKGKITHKCLNCGIDYPNTSTGNIKNPLQKTKQTIASKNQDKSVQNFNSKESYNFVEIMKENTTYSKNSADKSY